MSHPEQNSISTKKILLLLCMFLSGYCGILSELCLFNLGTVLLGGTNTTLLYTMGLMMFFMGIGSLLTETRLFSKIHFGHFAGIEILLSFLCMIAVPAIHILSAYYPRFALEFFFLFSPAIGLLIGMEIPIIMRLNQDMGLNLQENSARVMMADYFGSLMAFCLFPFLLFPRFGVAFSAYSGGLINLLLAFLTFVYFRKHFLHLKFWWGLFILQCLFAFWLSQNINRFIHTGEQLLYRDPIVLKRNTPYQKLVFTKKEPFRSESYTKRAKEAGKKIFESKGGRYELRKFDESFEKDIRFFINGGLQFSTVDEYRYHETLVHPAMHMVKDPGSALVLGGGDGLAVRELLKYKNLKEIVLVDLDRELTDLFQYSELARLNEHSLQNEKVRIFNGDAFQFLRKVKASFDVIIIDFPDPYSLQTSKLYTRQFYELVRFALAPGGVFCLQATSPLFNRKTFVSIGKTLESAGFEILPMQVSMKTFEDWGFYLGRPGQATPSNDWKGSTNLRSELLQINPEVPTKYLDQDSLKRGLYFGKDIFFDREKIMINDLNRLVLTEYYKGGLL